MTPKMAIGTHSLLTHYGYYFRCEFGLGLSQTIGNLCASIAPPGGLSLPPAIQQLINSPGAERDPRDSKIEPRN